MQRASGHPWPNNHTMDTTHTSKLTRRFKFNTQSSLGSGQESVVLSHTITLFLFSFFSFGCTGSLLMHMGFLYLH